MLFAHSTKKLTLHKLKNITIMAYTIKGLAKANECESYDIYSLANLWYYWLECNVCDRQSINDFKRLRKADRKEMLDFLRCDPSYIKLYNHIINNIF